MCKRPMELADTAEMMMSEDYKERFRAEYGQVAIRHQKLKAMLEKWDKGELNFTPTCPRSTYDLQIKAMADYIAVLEARGHGRYSFIGGCRNEFWKSVRSSKGRKENFSSWMERQRDVRGLSERLPGRNPLQLTDCQGLGHE